MRAVVIVASIVFVAQTMADPAAHVEKVAGKAFMPVIASPQRVGHSSAQLGAPTAPVDTSPVANVPVSSFDQSIAHLQGEIFKAQAANDRMKAEIGIFQSRMVPREGPQAQATSGDAQKWTDVFFGIGFGLGASLLASIIYRFIVKESRGTAVASMKPSDVAEMQLPATTALPLIPSGAGLRSVRVVMSEAGEAASGTKPISRVPLAPSMLFGRGKGEGGGMMDQIKQAREMFSPEMMKKYQELGTKLQDLQKELQETEMEVATNENQVVVVISGATVPISVTVSDALVASGAATLSAEVTKALKEAFEQSAKYSQDKMAAMYEDAGLQAPPPQ